MTVPSARVVRGQDIVGREHATPRPRRRLRIVVLLLLVPLVAVPVVAVAVAIVDEVSALRARERDSAPEEFDPVAVVQGTTLANSLRAELGSTDIALARFVTAVSAAKLAAIVPGVTPCKQEELGEVGLSMPTSARDTTSYRVRVSAPGEQVDPGSLAAVAVDAAHDLASFDDRPTAWNLRKLQRTAVKLHTIVFVVAVRTAASVQHRAAVSLFQPGTMRGTAYVYSARERRIRCAGAIDITNRDSIRYTYTEDLFADQGRQASADRALADDLDDQLIAAIATSLHAVD